jgi:hypothetical protein
MALLDFLKKKKLSEIKSLKEQLEYYRPVIDVDLEARQKLLEISELEIKRSELSRGYGAGLDTFTSLKKEIALFESKLDLIEYGSLFG